MAGRELVSWGSLAHTEPRRPGGLWYIQNPRNKSTSGQGHEEITHRDRGIQGMAAWIQERREDWSGPAAG